MCKVYNQIGSLTAIKAHLDKYNIKEFTSLQELISFKNNYAEHRQKIISNHISSIKEEKYLLSEDIKKLEIYIGNKKEEIENEVKLIQITLEEKLNYLHSTKTRLFKSLITLFKKFKIKSKIEFYRNNLDYLVAEKLIDLYNLLSDKKNRYEFILNNFDDAVKKSSHSDLNELKRKINVIEHITPTIYGAIGENMVSKELETLPDKYILINDFCCNFYPAIYNRKENEYIKSIQIDHLLISPSGIFLIETKNWSKVSLENLNLRSPVNQIKRTNFALFKILNEQISEMMDKHHWGDRKIPIRNIIVLINQKPEEEFQFVKILTLNELRGYVEYFKPIFSNQEVDILASQLNNLNTLNV